MTIMPLYVKVMVKLRRTGGEILQVSGGEILLKEWR
jgi:hypothetical protein